MNSLSSTRQSRSLCAQFSVSERLKRRKKQSPLPQVQNRALFTSVQDTYNFVKITAEYKFDDTVANGIVISQSIKPDTEIKSGTEIKLVVSKGPASIKLPDYTGLKVDQYTALLSQKNVKFEKKATSDTHGVKDGYVVKCSKEIGETVNVKDSEKVTVYYAKSGGSSSSSSTSSKTN